MYEILEAVILGGAGDDDIELAILHNVIIDREEIGNKRAPFNINSLTDEEVVLNFRFRRKHLPRLLYVFRMPNVIVTDTRNKIDGMRFVLGFTALLIVLKRIRLVDLKVLFNLSSQSISQIIKTTINVMLREKGNLLDDLDNLTWLNRDKMRVYAEGVRVCLMIFVGINGNGLQTDELIQRCYKYNCTDNGIGISITRRTYSLLKAIHNKGGAIDNCWDFIDGTARGICRPSINNITVLNTPTTVLLPVLSVHIQVDDMMLQYLVSYVP
ncbi:hypothetical protein FQA39_LY08560 [Lamprigera yunnana]|nr:hypothetical protein FQA39_LY08560 [Lamprigera yunnana]